MLDVLERLARLRFDPARDDVRWVAFPGGSATLARAPRFVDPAEVSAPGSLLAPMPGSVTKVAAAVGDSVAAGQALIWLEAMKMEHTITAPTGGVLAELNVTTGQQVDVGAVLARIDNPENPENPEGAS